jgi:alkanesulfonate monooxygenase SsuD/methylene tetrahydromethanopterin reductase-like flavin-dependent oxidoreductase (luciferase family)
VEITVRFDMRGPDFATPMPKLYAAALEMAEFVDQHGAEVLMFNEHHGSSDGKCPAPTVLAGALAARTSRVRLRIAAIQLPLHHPVEVAEHILVLDQVSGGRIEVAAGAGYVPSEFAMFGRALRERPRLMDDGLKVLGEALYGRPVTVNGHTFTVTPGPVQQPRPPLYVAGGVRASARRAALYGDGFYPLTSDPALRDHYRDTCIEMGRPVGPIIDTTGPMFVHVADDPEKAWELIGPHALHEINSYGRWAAESTTGDLHSPFQVLDDVTAARASGLYRIVTVDECIDLLDRLETAGQALVLTPLLAGLDPDTAWPSLIAFFQDVLPRFRANRQAAESAAGR